MEGLYSFTVLCNHLGESSLQIKTVVVKSPTTCLSEDYSHPDDHERQFQLILLGSNHLPLHIVLNNDYIWGNMC